MTEANIPSKSSGTDVGVLMVLAGALLLVHNLNVLQDLFEFWPVILIALGVGKLMESEEGTPTRS